MKLWNRILKTTMVAAVALMAGVMSLSAGAAQNTAANKAAIKAYRAWLKQDTLDWGRGDDVNKVANFQFMTYDLNGDNVKELLIYNEPAHSHGRYYGPHYKVYTYANGQVVDTGLYGLDHLQIYEKSNMFLTIDCIQGEGSYSLMKLTKSGKVKTMLTAHGLCADCFSKRNLEDMGTPVQRVGRMPGIKKGSIHYYKMYYTQFWKGDAINKKIVSYADFKKLLKKYKKSSNKLVKLNWHKNTYKNRRKYLK